MAKNKNIDQLRQQGWEEMSSLLDTHMPTEQNRPIIWWYWLAGAAALAVLVAVAWPFLTENGDSRTPIASQMENSVGIDNSRPDPSENSADISQNGSSADKSHRATGFDLPESPVDPIAKPSVSSPDQAIAAIPESDVSAPSSEKEEQSFATSDRNQSENVSVEAKSISNAVLRSSSVTLLDAALLQVDRPEPSLATFWMQAPIPIDVQQDAGKFRVLAFSEMMWALSDRFGFLNAGPGVAYHAGKWTVGASGGLAIPLPNQKTFDDTNLTFSTQYNFRQELAHQFSDFNTSASGKVVYYENYTMKPGFKFDLFAQVHLSPRWSIGIDVGRIGYRWDFSQKAVPNQTIAARTDLTDLKSEIWYGGITAGYHLGHHWKVTGGMRMINPGDPRNIGVLPVMRLEYRF